MVMPPPPAPLHPYATEEDRIAYEKAMVRYRRELMAVPVVMGLMVLITALGALWLGFAVGLSS